MLFDDSDYPGPDPVPPNFKELAEMIGAPFGTIVSDLGKIFTAFAESVNDTVSNYRDFILDYEIPVDPILMNMSPIERARYPRRNKGPRSGSAFDRRGRKQF